MALEDKIEAVNKVNKALNSPMPESEVVERVAPNKEKFDSLVNSEQANDSLQSKKTEEAALTIEKTNSPSTLMDEVKKLNSQVKGIGQLGPEDLKTQARNIIAQIDQVKTQLSEGGTLKPSYQNLLTNRLTHIDDNIKVALSKAGVEYTEVQQPTATGSTNPVERFIGFLTHGQYQPEHLHQTIDNLSLTNAQLTPANMLAMQIKVGQVQQEIELFTSLLNKALESTKTIMNVQV